MLVFLDLETTGLRPEKHFVLEVAAIITDDELTEIVRFTAVANWVYSHQLAVGREAERENNAWYADVDPYVLEMHTKNGLWAASAASKIRRYDIDQMLAAVIDETVRNAGGTPGEKTGPQLAGNTISFDRAFMRDQLPLSHALLSYRNVDVTTLNEMARRFWPAVHAARPRTAGDAHRAEVDVAESLATARYYAQALGPTPGVAHALEIGLSVAPLVATAPDGTVTHGIA
jgi:oligoribonuclease